MANVKLVEALHCLNYLMTDLDFSLYNWFLLEYLCKTSVTMLHDDPAAACIVVNKVLMNLHSVFILGFAHNLCFINYSLLGLEAKEDSFDSESLFVFASFENCAKRA